MSEGRRRQGKGKIDKEEEEEEEISTSNSSSWWCQTQSVTNRYTYTIYVFCINVYVNLLVFGYYNHEFVICIL